MAHPNVRNKITSIVILISNTHKLQINLVDKADARLTEEFVNLPNQTGFESIPFNLIVIDKQKN